MLEENNKKVQNFLIAILIILMCGIIFFYQTKKVGFHEDEIYSIASSVNPDNGLMFGYDENDKNQSLIWRTKEFVKNFITLTPNNYLNLISIFTNQAKDNHPPFFYILIHFSTILFAGKFTKYSVFIVNIIAFIFSCFIIRKILKLLNKENLIFATLIFYGLSMGTISMVIYQRMYMLLTFFILLYFYFNLQLYKNNFILDKKLALKLGITTVLGFLTQYFFAIYAFVIFILMIVKMVVAKKYKNIGHYMILHIIYAVIGILLFVPCIWHLLFTDRGISNLGNTGYFEHLYKYITHLAYSFSIQDNIITISIVLLAFLAGLCYWLYKCKDKFIVMLTIIPSILYFFIVVKLTSYQELRYIMPVIPFISLTFIFILDNIFEFKYKNILIITISLLFALNGLIFSKPKFLYEEYKDCINIAEQNNKKSFVYVYDNFFNHMQSIPEMMIYQKTLIANVNKDGINHIINNNELNSENSYILCIKTYLNNDEILEKIKNNTDFKNIQLIFKGGNSSEEISNNLYLVSK